MSRHISAERLRALRNAVPIRELIARHLEIPWKVRESTFRFLCPLCGEFNTATNPRTNLARCFRCKRNFNPIDMVMHVRGWDFLTAAGYLSELLAAPQRDDLAARFPVDGGSYPRSGFPVDPGIR